MEQIRLDRQTLYDKVWSTPMQHLAAEYGLSDVGLSKICKKLDVPRPARGHWAKTPDKRPAPPPLPEVRPGIPDHVVVARKPEAKKPNAPPVEPKAKGAATKAQHRLIVSAQKILSRAKPDERGMLTEIGDKPCLAIEASPDCLERALGVMDLVLKEMEANDLHVAVRRRTYRSGRDSVYETVAFRGEDDLSFSLREKWRRVDHVPTPAEERRRKRTWGTLKWEPIPKYDHLTTGQLTLAIEGYGHQTRKSWSDGKHQRLEKVYLEFVNEVVFLIDEAKKRRLERERVEKERREAAQREAMEKELRADLGEMVERWSRARAIREFLVEAEQAMESEGFISTDGVGQWLAWARQRSDDIDPLLQPRTIPKRLEPVEEE